MLHIYKIVAFTTLDVHGDVFTGVGRAVDLRLLRADFHPVCTCSFIEFVGEILKFAADATHEVNVISEFQVGDGSSTDGDRGVVVMKSLLQNLLKEKVKQDGEEQLCYYLLIIIFRKKSYFL